MFYYFSEDPIETGNSVKGTDLELHWEELGVSKIPADWPLKYPGHRKSKDTFTVFYVSDVPSPVGLWVAIHGHLEEEKLAVLQINVNRKPKTDPPERVKNVSSELGGFEGLKQFWGFVEGLQGKCAVDIGILYKNSPLKVGRREFGPMFDPFKLESETYDLSWGDIAVDFTLLEDNGAHVNSTQTLDLALGPECIELAAQKIVSNLHPLWATQ